MVNSINKYSDHYLESQKRNLYERILECDKAEIEESKKCNSFKTTDYSLPFFIPKKLYDVLIKEFENIRRKGMSPDAMVFIVKRILEDYYWTQVFKPNDSDVDDYRGTSINDEKLKKYISKRKAHLRFLENNKIIAFKQFYSTNQSKPHSNRYEIVCHCNEFKEYRFSEDKFTENYISLYSNLRDEIQDDSIKENLKKNVDFIKKLKLTVPKEELLEITKDFYGESLRTMYNHQLMIGLSVAKNNDEVMFYLRPSHGRNHNRIYDTFKNLKRELKSLFNFVQGGKEYNIVDLDIPNSHALFHGFHLAEKFRELFLSTKDESVSANSKISNKYIIKKYLGKKVIKMSHMDEEFENELGNPNYDILGWTSTYPIYAHYHSVEVDFTSLKNELESLIDAVVSGIFYEQFYINENCNFQDATINYNNRDQAKKAFQFFVNDKSTGRTAVIFWEAYKQRYPNIALFIFYLRNHHESEIKDKKYGYHLNKMESVIRLAMIKKCTNARQNVMMFDMHDGFLVPDKGNNIEKVKDAFKKCCVDKHFDEVNFISSKYSTKSKLAEALNLKEKN